MSPSPRPAAHRPWNDSSSGPVRKYRTEFARASPSVAVSSLGHVAGPHLPRCVLAANDDPPATSAQNLRTDPLRGGAHALQLAHLGEAAQRGVLDLADTLGGDAQGAAGLAEALRLAAVDPVAHAYALALAIGKLGDGAAHGLAVERDGDLLVGPLALGGKQRAEGRLLVGPADRPVEADDGALRLTRLLDVARLEARRGDELFLGGLAPELGLQLALGLGDLALADADVRRDANRARAVLDPALDRLADPERRVR